jgi:hypothetical protein
VPAVLVFTPERTRLAQLPTLEPLNGGMGPEINNRFEITGGRLVTGVGWYASGDIHVIGPSIHVTLLWRWTGRGFTTTLPFSPPCRSGVASVAVGGICIETPARWVAVRDVSTELGADWVDVRPVEACHPAHGCVGFQVYARSSFDRVIAGSGTAKAFDQGGDWGWWTGAGTPECHTNRHGPNPIVHSELALSTPQSIGPVPAEHRSWTVICQNGDHQEVHAWFDSASRLLIISGPLPTDLQQHVPPVVAGATIS